MDCILYMGIFSITFIFVSIVMDFCRALKINKMLKEQNELERREEVEQKYIGL